MERSTCGPRGKFRIRAAIGLAVGTICACTHAPPVALTPGVSSAPAAIRQLAPFSPRPASGERKSKLQAAARQLDELYGARFERASATSAVVGVVMDGELVYTSSFGTLDVARSARPDANTSFRIGSLSKSFAATAILKLRDEAKLGLDEPAQRYVPELAKVHGAAAGSPPISIRHLLTMTSGLAYDDTWGPVSYGYDERELTRLFEEGVTLASQPGDRVAYSNLGYALLGLVIERISGQTFRDYVTSNVLQPLGMTSSVWVPAKQRMAIGYHRKGAELRPEPHPDDGVFAPAGGIYSNLNDFSRYVAFQLAAYADPGAPEAAPLLRSTVREMHRGHAWLRWGHDVPVASYDAAQGMKMMTSSYGFGWVNNTTCDYEGMVQHGGYEPGYYAYVRLLPRHGLGMIVFSATASIADYATFHAALGILKEQGLLDEAEPMAPALRGAQQSVNRLLTHWDDALGRATFDPGSLQYSWFATVGDDLQRLSREHGRCEPEGDLAASSATQASWRMRCARGVIDFSVWLNPATRPQVQHLTWQEYPPAGSAVDVTFTVPPRLVANATCQGG